MIESEAIRKILEVMEWMLKNQLGRRNLTDASKAEIAMRYEDVIKRRMKARQQMSEGRGNKKGCLNSDNLKETHTTSTDKELADIAGVSKYVIQGTRKILNEGTEEQKQRARDGGKGNTINSILKEIECTFIRVLRVINFNRCNHTLI